MLNAYSNRNPTAYTICLTTLLGLLGAAIGGVAASAQTQATLPGMVADPQSSGIPQVTLSLTTMDGSSKREVQSDQNGRFAFDPLSAGTYKLEVQLPGFRLFSDTVTLASRDIDRTVQLSIGGVTETITVALEGGAPSDPPEGQAEARIAAREPESCTAPSSGGHIRPPKKLTDVRPLYPPQLAGTGTTGFVIMEGTIGTDGSVRDLRVLKSPHAALDQAATDAVRQWRFDATLLNCVPIDVAITVAVNFVEAK